jgi:hypothetical protein
VRFDLALPELAVSLSLTRHGCASAMQSVVGVAALTRQCLLTYVTAVQAIDDVVTALALRPLCAQWADVLISFQLDRVTPLAHLGAAVAQREPLIGNGARANTLLTLASTKQTVRLFKPRASPFEHAQGSQPMPRPKLPPGLCFPAKPRRISLLTGKEEDEVPKPGFLELDVDLPCTQ